MWANCLGRSPKKREWANRSFFLSKSLIYSLFAHFSKKTSNLLRKQMSEFPALEKTYPYGSAFVWQSVMCMQEWAGGWWSPQSSAPDLQALGDPGTRGTRSCQGPCTATTTVLKVLDHWTPRHLNFYYSAASTVNFLSLMSKIGWFSSWLRVQKINTGI